MSQTRISLGQGKRSGQKRGASTPDPVAAAAPSPDARKSQRVTAASNSPVSQQRPASSDESSTELNVAELCQSIGEGLYDERVQHLASDQQDKFDFLLKLGYSKVKLEPFFKHTRVTMGHFIHMVMEFECTAEVENPGLATIPYDVRDPDPNSNFNIKYPGIQKIRKRFEAAVADYRRSDGGEAELAAMLSVRAEIASELSSEHPGLLTLLAPMPLPPAPSARAQQLSKREVLRQAKIKWMARNQPAVASSDNQ